MPQMSVANTEEYLAFLKSYLAFTGGTLAADVAAADGALIGKPHTIFRQIRTTSPFGNTVVLVTDGQLPYPYGREVVGYAVPDVAATIAKAQTAGATVLAPPVTAAQSALLQFPGGFIAEFHQG